MGECGWGGEVEVVGGEVEHAVAVREQLVHDLRHTSARHVPLLMLLLHSHPMTPLLPIPVPPCGWWCAAPCTPALDAVA